MPHKYALTGKEADREVDLIERCLHWPRFPWLPVKRTTDGGLGPELGVVSAHDITEIDLEVTGARVRVFDVNLVKLNEHAETDEDGKVTISIDALPVREEFATVRDLVDGGWRGD